MGRKCLAGGKPSTIGKILTRGKPTWFQHQLAWGKVAPASPSIPNTIDMYHGQPFPKVSNPLWGQPNLASILPQGSFSLSICKLHDSNAKVPSTKIHGGTI